MKNKKRAEPQNGLLTERMDVSSPEFKQFQAILLDKLKEQTRWQKINIELAAIRIQMEDYIESDNKSEPKLLGEFLKSFLNTLNIRRNRFANYLEIDPTNLSKIIKGERQINPETALKIGKTFGLDPLLLLKIQIKNELSKLTGEKNQQIEKYSLNNLMEEAVG